MSDAAVLTQILKQLETLQISQQALQAKVGGPLCQKYSNP